MCGIVGVASNLGVSNKLVNWAEEASRSLMHRGPDDKGLLLSENKKICFAHRRLTIIDLSKAGHQPLVSQSKRFSIVFNGEIYNFKFLRDELIKYGYDFHSSGDSEVVLNIIDLEEFFLLDQRNQTPSCNFAQAATKSLILGLLLQNYLRA